MFVLVVFDTHLDLIHIYAQNLKFAPRMAIV